MLDNFYKAFEDRFRGSREEIKRRLLVYLPFIRPLLNYYQDSQVVDLGCGRGEWLEVLAEQGCNALGVDLDEAMLSVCAELNLPACKHDAIAYLENLPDASKVVISGFHIAEHLPFEDLKNLVDQSLRALKPGGLLILETPNPENLVVGSSSFYLDPTHERPIPPPLLSFLPEYSGFERVKILRLQESPELTKANSHSLFAVLNGASPDFAVVAQKKGPIELKNSMNPVFEIEYGVSMEMLANRFDYQTEFHAQEIRRELTRALDVAQQAQVQAQQAEFREQEIRRELTRALDVAQQAQVQAQQTQVEKDLLGSEILKIYQSNSWRMTKIFRWARSQAKLIRRHGLLVRIKAFAKKLIKYSLRYVARVIEKRPEFKSLIIKILKKTDLLGFARRVYFWSFGMVGVPQLNSLIELKVRGLMKEINCCIGQRENELSIIYLEIK